MTYTGIGSRGTPEEILQVMEGFARALPFATLRSGGASGADSAFEQGAIKKEIYLPWKGFNGNKSERYPPTEAAMELTAQYHPAWDHLSTPVKLLMARNAHQILGPELDDPTEIVVCWTPDGSLNGRGRKCGGTGQALRIASAYGITILNLAREDHLKEARLSVSRLKPKEVVE